mgnify:CR=1 FL=1
MHDGWACVAIGAAPCPGPGVAVGLLCSLWWPCGGVCSACAYGTCNAADPCVDDRGLVEQQGSPTEIIKRPRTPFIMKFVGETNVVPATSLVRGSAG